MSQSTNSAMELFRYLINGLIRNKEEGKRGDEMNDKKGRGNTQLKGKGIREEVIIVLISRYARFVRGIIGADVTL